MKQKIKIQHRFELQSVCNCVAKYTAAKIKTIFCMFIVLWQVKESSLTFFGVDMLLRTSANKLKERRFLSSGDSFNSSLVYTVISFLSNALRLTSGVCHLSTSDSFVISHGGMRTSISFTCVGLLPTLSLSSSTDCWKVNLRYVAVVDC